MVNASCSVADFHAASANLLRLETTLASKRADYDEVLSTVWMLLAAYLIFFLNAGFAMHEAGCLRYKNSTYVLTKNLFLMSIGFLCWYSFGYAIAFGVAEKHDGTPVSRFSGSQNYFLAGFWENKEWFRDWFYHGTFCATSLNVVSGAMAERTNLVGFGIFTVIMTGVIYPTIVYWGWSGSGLLNYKSGDEMISFAGPPLIDFAGSGIVHLCGGMAGLIGALTVGPRQDRWDPAFKRDFDEHSIPFCVLGTFCLWFGWYGFTPGSHSTMISSGDAHSSGLVACNITLAPAAAGLLVLCLRATVLQPKCVDAVGFCNGILSGLVAITAGVAVMRPYEAILTGFVAGLIYLGSAHILREFKVDDVVDGISVHGACGLWGLISSGLFGRPADGLGGNGLFYGGSQLGTQIFAIMTISVWVGFCTSAVFLPLKWAGLLRLTDQQMSELREQGDHMKMQKVYEENRLSAEMERPSFQRDTFASSTEESSVLAS